MFDLLHLTLQQQPPEIANGTTETLHWQWLGEGMLLLTPRQPTSQHLVLSAGIHGNETAPIELLNGLVNELLSAQRSLAVNLLILFGNPAAMRAGKRYLDYDLNRLFVDCQPELTATLEGGRAIQLKQVVRDFFPVAADPVISGYHYDLHTTLRASLHPRFALLPYQSQPYDQSMLNWLDGADLDALVVHRSAGGTFSHFTANRLSATSCTLELGKALPFGCNDLSQFSAINQALQRLVSGEASPVRSITTPLQVYQVITSLIKHSEHFQLRVADETANFTPFPQGQVMMEQHSPEEHYVVQHPQEWILFPNPQVAIGLRAGLMLKKISLTALISSQVGGINNNIIASSVIGSV